MSSGQGQEMAPRAPAAHRASLLIHHTTTHNTPHHTSQRGAQAHKGRRWSRARLSPPCTTAHSPHFSSFTLHHSAAHSHRMSSTQGHQVVLRAPVPTAAMHLCSFTIDDCMLPLLRQAIHLVQAAHDDGNSIFLTNQLETAAPATSCLVNSLRNDLP